MVNNVYHATFRSLDPSIGRWWQVDPMAEKYYGVSPYNSMGDNPVRFNDPNVDDWWRNNGEFRWYDSEAHQGDFFVDAEGNTWENYGASFTIGFSDTQDLALYDGGGWGLVGSSNYTLDAAEIVSGVGSLPDGRYLWELNNEEFIQFTDPLGRVELFGGKFDIELNLAERFYLAGKLAMWTMPTARPLLVAKSSSKVLSASKQASKWLGKDFKTITNKAGDKIFISKDGLKKMRFDIKNPHGDAPHIHLEIFKNGKWRDAIPGNHRIYPKQ